jgi:hypothetical protein
MSIIVGFDSKDYRRVGGRGNEYFALIGVGIEVPHPENFREAFSESLESAFESRGRDLLRVTHKRMHLLRLFGPDDGSQLSREVIQSVSRHISNLTVFYTIIQPWKVREVWTFKDDRTWGKLTPVDFMHQLSTSYVHICAWKYTGGGRDAGKDLALDGFQGRQTKAWDELAPHSVRMYYRGDTCNPILSAADLIVASIDESVESYHFSEAAIERAVRSLDFGIQWTSEYIGIPHFEWIKPYTRKMIDTSRHVARPIYYILPEDTPPNVNRKQTRMQLELSSLYGKVVDAACASDGCIKLYDPTEDVGRISEPTARVTYYGEKGKALGNELKTLYGVSPIDLRSDKLT